MVLGATLTLVLVQLNAASKLAGSRPFRFFGPSRLHKVVEHQHYREHLQELMEAAEPHFVLFTSGVSSDGSPWCPDCSKSNPIIREVIFAAGGSLLEVTAGDRNEWADRKHPIRVDAQCPVHYVPTLYYWTPAGCGSSIANPLNSDEQDETLRLLVAKFVAETAAGQRYVDAVTKDIIASGGKACNRC
ncbi:hypothetical protein CHLRE_12g549500v5 [Chlamydomonas reinhardtii]|uniref:Thioredoxin domain-containing protein n=1 Tax=Chlamydomonas reinhardtii TaxID=3055 RepID=A0A2K3D696_CHLRE|nr:uncharacterized protein CHLRE_12g549500v5 [Chlamydomonas reinhardtii]PNW76053.1 hypothetical protein CHLRE_12g549500v5 [Chlamydomonas reinhardtii]